MNIDRHNYEEYFLLYIDNELTVDQKKQVELFVQENPDLEEELVMLKQSRLVPDDSIVFDQKHLLMKEENAQHSASNSFINLNNYEQWLIMYVDDELSAPERVAVEKFAKAHPHVQEELAIFLQTKLQPEELVFPNKQSLFRTEKTVRVISIQWWKIAVAAVLILSAGVTVYSVLINKNDKAANKEIARTTNEKKQAPVSANPIVSDHQEATINDQPTEQMTASIPENNKSNIERKEQKQQKVENVQQLAYSPVQQPGETTDVQPATVEINKTTIEQPKMTEAVALDDKMHKENINTELVTNRVVETPDKSSTSDDAVQYASNTENKKFRGFFRKATRILERTTSINAADDDKVLIGGMAINLK